MPSSKSPRSTTSLRPPPAPQGADGFFNPPVYADTQDHTHTDTHVHEYTTPQPQKRVTTKPDRESSAFNRLAPRIAQKYRDELDDVTKDLQRAFRAKGITLEEVVEAILAIGVETWHENPRKNPIREWFEDDMHLRVPQIEGDTEDFD